MTRVRGLPLRTQLVALLVAVSAVTVALAGLAGAAALRGYLYDRVDRQLVAALADPGGPAGPRGRRPAAVRDVLLARYNGAGELLASSVPGLEPTSLPAVRGVPPRDPATVASGDGATQWRAVGLVARDGSYLVAAVPVDDVEDTVARLLVINGVVGAGAVALGAVVALVAVRRSLRPLAAVEGTAHAIAAGDLTRRVPDADPRTEVGSLAASFNAMVDRFEAAYSAQQQSESAARASEERMRQFVADASHELRTPLTSVRGFAELYRQGAVPVGDDLDRVMRRIEDEAARMGLLVEDLLQLARLDQQRPLERAPVDLLQVCADVVHDARAHSASHDVVLAAGSAAAVVTGDEARLRQVVTNLVTNAVVHTPAGTRVEVSLRAVLGDAVVEVRDDGPGMEADVAARAFERFYRADAARTRTTRTSGSGLGLSIVAALVAAHGGRVELETRPGEGATFRVLLPLA